MRINAQKTRTGDKDEAWDNQTAIKARQARKAQLRVIQAAKKAPEGKSVATTETTKQQQLTDPRKAAIAAAIAPAKAKRDMQSKS